jgi:hypothetical protein
MAPIASADDVAAVKIWLPIDHAANGWDDATIAERWTGGVASTVRAYWFARVSDTAGYLDLSDAGGSLPITQIYRQAREMLDYWDNFLKANGDVDPNSLVRQTRIGKIKRRYAHEHNYPPPRAGLRSPYNPLG